MKQFMEVLVVALPIILNVLYWVVVATIVVYSVLAFRVIDRWGGVPRHLEWKILFHQGTLVLMATVVMSSLVWWNPQQVPLPSCRTSCTARALANRQRVTRTRTPRTGPPARSRRAPHAQSFPPLTTRRLFQKETPRGGASLFFRGILLSLCVGKHLERAVGQRCCGRNLICNTGVNCSFKLILWYRRFRKFDNTPRIHHKGLSKILIVLVWE